MNWMCCENCGELFEEHDARVEVTKNIHYWLDDKPVEEWCDYLCPECGSADIHDAPYCDNCGDAVRPEDLIDGLCEMCRKELSE